MSEKTTSVRNRSAFITGASAGIGKALALALLRDGWQVWGTSRDLQRLDSFSSERGFHPVEFDLAEPSRASHDEFKSADETAGGFQLVVNNAGFGHFGMFAETKWPEWQTQLQAMISQTTALIHEQVRLMRQREGGTIVNVSSLATEFPLPFMSGYNMSKAAISALSESLVQELRGTGICVIDFRPGDVRTGFNKAMSADARDAINAQPDSDLAAAWRKMETHVAAAPSAEQVVAALLRAVKKGRPGVVRSGGFFQATLAPSLIRLAPQYLARHIRWRYFGI